MEKQQGAGETLFPLVSSRFPDLGGKKTGPMLMFVAFPPTRSAFVLSTVYIFFYSSLPPSTG